MGKGLTNGGMDGAGGMAFSEWLKRIGRGKVTGWKWRAKGWIRPQDLFNIDGKLFITDRGIATFWTRAGKGEFARDTEDGVAKPKAVKL